MPRTLSAPAVRPPAPTELDRLQGSWTTIAGPHPARLLIAGRRFAFEFCDRPGAVYIGSFALSDEVPGQMDMQIDEGPAPHRGQLSHCLFHLDGDILRWCPTPPGSTARLTTFPSVDDDKYLSLVFKQGRPPRQGGS